MPFLSFENNFGLLSYSTTLLTWACEVQHESLCVLSSDLDWEPVRHQDTPTQGLLLLKQTASRRFGRLSLVISRTVNLCLFPSTDLISAYLQTFCTIRHDLALSCNHATSIHKTSLSWSLEKSRGTLPLPYPASTLKEAIAFVGPQPALQQSGLLPFNQQMSSIVIILDEEAKQKCSSNMCYLSAFSFPGIRLLNFWSENHEIHPFKYSFRLYNSASRNQISRLTPCKCYAHGV
jgi:hypothetical protein